MRLPCHGTCSGISPSTDTTAAFSATRTPPASSPTTCAGHHIFPTLVPIRYPRDLQSRGAFECSVELGTALAELFPTAVRYTGASPTFNLAGILGGSLAPYIATYLAGTHGIAYVGYYLVAAATLTLAAQLLLKGRHSRAVGGTVTPAAVTPAQPPGS